VRFISPHRAEDGQEVSDKGVRWEDGSRGNYEADADGCCDGCGGFFLQFRDRLISGFPSLFGEERGDIDYTVEGQFAQRWGWFPLFYTLANGDATKFDQASKLPASFAFSFLAFEKDRNEAENKILKKNLK